MGRPISKKSRLIPKDISYEEDIAREVSEKLKLPLDMCLEVQQNIFKFAVEQTKERDVYAINFPTLGILYLNYTMCRIKKYSLYSKFKNKDNPKAEKEYDFWNHRMGMMLMVRDNEGAYKHYIKPFHYYFRTLLPWGYQISSKKTPEDIYTAVEDLQNIGFYEKD